MGFQLAPFLLSVGRCAGEHWEGLVRSHRIVAACCPSHLCCQTVDGHAKGVKTAKNWRLFIIVMFSKVLNSTFFLVKHVLAIRKIFKQQNPTRFRVCVETPTSADVFMFGSVRPLAFRLLLGMTSQPTWCRGHLEARRVLRAQSEAMTVWLASLH